MKKVLLTIFLAITVFFGVKAQEHDWSFGLYSDIKMQTEGHGTTFGLLGKYDFSKRSGIQVQVHGRTDFVSVGADYLVTILDKTKSNFNVYLGGGFSQDFYGETTTLSDLNVALSAVDYSVVNGQAGVSYYFEPVKLSVFSGYKLKHILNSDLDNRNTHYLTIGLRYHLW